MNRWNFFNCKCKCEVPLIGPYAFWIAHRACSTPVYVRSPQMPTCTWKSGRYINAELRITGLSCPLQLGLSLVAALPRCLRGIGKASGMCRPVYVPRIHPRSTRTAPEARGPSDPSPASTAPGHSPGVCAAWPQCHLRFSICACPAGDPKSPPVGPAPPPTYTRTAAQQQAANGRIGVRTRSAEGGAGAGFHQRMRKKGHTQNQSVKCALRTLSILAWRAINLPQGASATRQTSAGQSHFVRPSLLWPRNLVRHLHRHRSHRKRSRCRSPSSPPPQGQG